MSEGKVLIVGSSATENGLRSGTGETGIDLGEMIVPGCATPVSLAV